MKFLNSDGLKVVLGKIKEMFYTKTEVDEKLKSVSGGGTEFEEKITIRTSAQKGYFFNFYKKGNVVKIFEILEEKTEYSYNVPDNFLPKGFGKYDSFIIGELFTKNNQTKTSLTISKNKGLRITDYRDSIANLKYDGFYGEIFVGEYFTN